MRTEGGWMIVELGAGSTPDPRSDVRLDVVPAPEIDARVDLDHRPWPLRSGVADGVIASHVIEHLADPVAAFGEIARLLVDGGWVEVRVPVGENYHSDPTHRSPNGPWTWRTPVFLSREHPRPGEVDLPFEIEHRAFEDLHCTGPGRVVSPFIRLAAAVSPGKWVTGTPWLCGEFVARFRRTTEGSA